MTKGLGDLLGGYGDDDDESGDEEEETQEAPKAPQPEEGGPAIEPAAPSDVKQSDDTASVASKSVQPGASPEEEPLQGILADEYEDGSSSESADKIRMPQESTRGVPPELKDALQELKNVRQAKQHTVLKELAKRRDHANPYGLEKVMSDFKIDEPSCSTLPPEIWDPASVMDDPQTERYDYIAKNTKFTVKSVAEYIEKHRKRRAGFEPNGDSARPRKSRWDSGEPQGGASGAPPSGPLTLQRHGSAGPPLVAGLTTANGGLGVLGPLLGTTSMPGLFPMQQGLNAGTFLPPFTITAAPDVPSVDGDRASEAGGLGETAPSELEAEAAP
uniref:Uncharacterized protein n=1 Tax=Chromera velia CCMP2878 TaxID=1169474 RepID=A0A0G4I3R6_9ALVE|eukprot:Cvel_10668.t1-p1 / transcript=Cvel_10668.t1 / gene=Cvel_10668 / organism=Chromera_velia_CCMP2878 / gene_product=hypothetical protein / transcript_product=hypothetical protein / location=Cvel_scaffold648:51988-55785(-) / protein_length=329 / sequence_SO=supercontig / SO=protein_coding / is_pseudo=false